MFKKKKIKSIYSLVLLLPLMFVLLYKLNNKADQKLGDFHFYTSLKSAHLDSIQFLKNETQIHQWNGPFKVYKQIDYIENKSVEDDSGYRLKIFHSNKNDTIAFLGLNFLLNGLVYSLQAEDSINLKSSSNSKILIQNGQLQLICLDNRAVFLQLNKPLTWSNNSLQKTKYLFFAFLIFGFVLPVLLFKPSNSWFLISLGTCIGLLFYFYFLGKDPSGQIIVTNFGPHQKATFYFNSTPDFKNSLSVNYNDTNDTRKTQSYPGVYSFYRIDFLDSLYTLNSCKISYAMGILRHTWLLDNFSPLDLNGNDLDYQNGQYSISGSDPYICLTGSNLNWRIRFLDFFRLNYFVLLCLVSFHLLLFSERFIKTKLKTQNLIVFPFILICFAPIMYSLSDSQRLIMSEEKRLAFPFPTFSLHEPLKDYTKQLDNYMKDQLPGRGQLIISNNLIKYKLFSELATNTMVYFGKENWMFYIGENVKDVYENKHLYTDEELNTLTRHLEERRDWLKSKGIAYYILFPRMSHYFYQEFVGKGIHQYTIKPRLEQFMEHLKKHSTINVIDVYTPMLHAKNTYDRDLYYHSDSHWNLFGAYFAYEEVIKRVKVDFPKVNEPIPLKDINWIEDESTEADLSKLISLSQVITRHEYLPLHPDVNSSTPVAAPDYPEYHSVHPLIVYQGKDSAAPKLVMNRDSYSNFLIPYFSKHFSRQTYIWSPLFFPTIIEKEKPDIVITEMMERFLNDLLIENPPLQIDTLRSQFK